MLSVMLEGGLSKYCRAEKEGVHLQKWLEKDGDAALLKNWY